MDSIWKRDPDINTPGLQTNTDWYAQLLQIYLTMNLVSFILAGISILISIIIITCAILLHRNPRTRHTVDRVSFRLMCLAIGVEIIYDAMYIAIYAGDGYGLPTKTCGVMVYFMFIGLGTSNWLFTSIAVNLMLIIVFGVNPQHKRLEKWYILGSFLLGVGVPTIPAILGHFGTDDSYETCYFTSTNPVTRRIHFVFDLYLWQGLSCLISLICTIAVLIKLYRTSRHTARVLFKSNQLNASVLSSSKLYTLNERYTRIALRIMTYPIVLVFMNSIVTDLWLNESGIIKTYPKCIMLIIYTFCYGARGLLLALLGLFVDPCLLRGYRAYRALPPMPPPFSITSHEPNIVTPVLPSDSMVISPSMMSQDRSRYFTSIYDIGDDPNITDDGEKDLRRRDVEAGTSSEDSTERAEELYNRVEAQL